MCGVSSGLPSSVPVVRTLSEAHEVLGRLWPGRHVSLAEQIAYRKVCAALYAEVADIDRAQYESAIRHAQREAHTAEDLEARLALWQVAQSMGARGGEGASLGSQWRALIAEALSMSLTELDQLLPDTSGGAP